MHPTFALTVAYDRQSSPLSQRRRQSDPSKKYEHRWVRHAAIALVEFGTELFPVLEGREQISIYTI